MEDLRASMPFLMRYRHQSKPASTSLPIATPTPCATIAAIQPTGATRAALTPLSPLGSITTLATLLPLLPPGLPILSAFAIGVGWITFFTVLGPGWGRP